MNTDEQLQAAMLWKDYTEKFLTWLEQNSPDDLWRIQQRDITDSRMKRLMKRYEAQHPEAAEDKPIGE